MHKAKFYMLSFWKFVQTYIQIRNLMNKIIQTLVEQWTQHRKYDKWKMYIESISWENAY